MNRDELLKAIEKANSEIEPMDISRRAYNKTTKQYEEISKPYAEVKERVAAYRKVYPGGSIQAEILSHQNGIVLMRATVTDDSGSVISTGYASEVVTSEGVNQYNALENAETSAIGRALGFAGFGIKQSIASANEMARVKQREEEKAAADQNKLLTKKQLKTLKGVVANREEILEWIKNIAKVETLEQLTEFNAKQIIQVMQQKGLINEKGETNNEKSDSDQK